MDNIILNVQDVKKKFGNKQALRGVSFNIYKGDIVGYLGPNGSGKTTTIMSIVNLINVDSGKIKIFDYNVKNEYTKLLGKVAVAFDENGLFEDLSARDNITFLLKAYDILDEKDYAAELVEKMDLKSDLDRKVSTFSKGMKRKLALIRCLLLRPSLILLDEPFDGIDVEHRDKIIRILREYHDKTNTSILLTTHVMADVEELANRVIVIKEGMIVVDETMDKFMQRGGKNVTENYLEVLNDGK